MKKFLTKFLTLLVFLLFSVSTFASDYKDLRNYLQHKIEITTLDIKALKLKYKAYKDETYGGQIIVENEKLKNLKEELKIVKQAIEEQERNQKLESQYNESEMKLKTLVEKVDNIAKYENFK